MSEKLNRRELKTRQSNLAKKTAKWLSSKAISPNQISIISILFAAMGGVSLYYFSNSRGVWLWLLPLASAIFIQCRLLCNLFDGMVAVEGGKKTPSGELFNDIPDRISDSLLFIGAGYAMREFHELGVILGFLAALLAVLTAYIRTLATATGAPSDFCGPMAKQHRMFVLTVACIITSLEPLLTLKSGATLFIALIVISIGSFITCIRRAKRAYRHLENKNV